MEKTDSESRRKPVGTPLECAARMLSARPLARAELKRKLHDRGFSWKEAEDTVLECERLGFLNDPETAESYVRSMRNCGDGSRKIKMKLRLRGFRKEDVENAFLRDDAASERTELDVALEVLRRKKAALDREPDALKRKTKALRALASKGFPPDAAFRALDEFFGRRDGTFFQDGEIPPGT